MDWEEGTESEGRGRERREGKNEKKGKEIERGGREGGEGKREKDGRGKRERREGKSWK